MLACPVADNVAHPFVSSALELAKVEDIQNTAQRLNEERNFRIS